ncbi:MAG: hypothetical protein R3A47_10250 [Polyangiales bacterium]
MSLVKYVFIVCSSKVRSPVSDTNPIRSIPSSNSLSFCSKIPRNTDTMPSIVF